ncbi:hypothetical protein KCH_01120 [Kitasatospora cheerisanensis KCTC 2395]|uniref:Uncharacterized protein n=1 Tax=Kitasatospora cheerisanensis KCTC 2395 TaxID=1348663 RepID=A0A066ZD07_9ACTN|nr:hypothetical protein KCH_01120 [Kitasatospora cheerisanensis KCTC 2395]
MRRASCRNSPTSRGFFRAGAYGLRQDSWAEGFVRVPDRLAGRTTVEDDLPGFPLADRWARSGSSSARRGRPDAGGLAVGG